MKISCDIIRDILPLYAENMTSQASNDMVEEHLGECEGCKKALTDIRQPAILPGEIPTHNLNHVKKVISKRRILTALTVGLLVISIFVGMGTFLDAEVFLTAEQAVHSVEKLEDGSIRIYWNDIVTGTGSLMNDLESQNLGVIAMTRVRKLLRKNNENSLQGDFYTTEERTHSTFGGAHPMGGWAMEDEEAGMACTNNFWYINYRDCTAEQLLWDGGADSPPPKMNFGDYNYHLAWYCAIAGILCANFALITCLLKGRRAKKWVRCIALFFGSTCISALLASGGQFVEHWGEFTDKLNQSWIPFVPFFLTSLCAMKLHDLKKQDTL